LIAVPAHIIKDCIQGKRTGQQQLYNHCYAGMIKLCLRYCNSYDDAGALYNEAMLKVFNKLHTVKEEASLMGWIRKIVVNTCVDYCRRKVKFAAHSLEASIETDAFIQPEVYTKIAAAETMQLLRQLPANTALVFNLFVTEGYRHDEIAAMLGIATGTSKWHLNEARRLLKEKMEILSKNKNYSNVI
jgi:RNA polymerase sigma-70 factor, ECF subfamily